MGWGGVGWGGGGGGVVRGPWVVDHVDSDGAVSVEYPTSFGYATLCMIARGEGWTPLFLESHTSPDVIQI